MSGDVPIRDRKAGKALCDSLRKGDILFIAKLDRAFRNVRDGVCTIDDWGRQGVRVCIADPHWDFNPEDPFSQFMMTVLLGFGQLERELTKRRTREAMGVLKRNGQCNSKYAGYGFKWVYSGKWITRGDKRVREKVRARDDEERDLMRQMLKWRLEGASYDNIYQRLNCTLKLKTKDAKEWSISRIRRVIAAELRLRVVEETSPETTINGGTT
jgi:DNA invertase Pin-like site-specific DNA recombinase